MNRWLVSVPVWGERYVDEFCCVALPLLDRAVRLLEDMTDVEPRLIVHTDQPDRIGALSSSVVELRPVPAGARGFDCMSQAHREVLRTGLRGDVVVLLTAGVVMSAGSLLGCYEVLQGNPRLRAVLCAVPRILSESGPLPADADGGALMRWAWENRHPMTRECTWPDGRSRDLSRTYFEAPSGAVVTRQALPHPLAVRIDGRSLGFTPTVDANLINNFDVTEMAVVTDSRSVALAKLSPADKGFDLGVYSMRQAVDGVKLVINDPRQRWSMSHRMVLVPGDLADCADEAFVQSIRG